MQSIKQKHIELENMLFTTEKLCSMAELNGLYAWNGEAFEKVEKSLAMLEFHDIASGTCAQDGEKSSLRKADCYQSATPELFEASARTFGRFQRLLNGYPAETLHETIPNFHDTEDRFAKFQTAVAADKLGRAKEVQPEIQFVLDRRADCSVALNALKEGVLPLRVTHNDTKLNNNILIDRESHEGICVIDLDTTMPGLSINDFGDSIRFGANHSAEDEKDLSKVNLDLGLCEVFTRGFLQGADGMLTEAELEYLPWGARLMTLECGIRFLTDYLDGDNYFHVCYPEQNLDRSRTQFKLVWDMEQQFEDMREIVKKYAI